MEIDDRMQQQQKPEFQLSGGKETECNYFKSSFARSLTTTTNSSSNQTKSLLDYGGLYFESRFFIGENDAVSLPSFSSQEVGGEMMVEDLLSEAGEEELKIGAADAKNGATAEKPVDNDQTAASLLSSSTTTLESSVNCVWAKSAQVRLYFCCKRKWFIQHLAFCRPLRKSMILSKSLNSRFSINVQFPIRRKWRCYD